MRRGCHWHNAWHKRLGNSVVYGIVGRDKMKSESKCIHFISGCSWYDVPFCWFIFSIASMHTKQVATWDKNFISILCTFKMWINVQTHTHIHKHTKAARSAMGCCFSCQCSLVLTLILWKSKYFAAHTLTHPTEIRFIEHIDLVPFPLFCY